MFGTSQMWWPGDGGDEQVHNKNSKGGKHPSHRRCKYKKVTVHQKVCKNTNVVETLRIDVGGKSVTV